MRRKAAVDAVAVDERCAVMGAVAADATRIKHAVAVIGIHVLGRSGMVVSGWESAVVEG